MFGRVDNAVNLFALTLSGKETNSDLDTFYTVSTMGEGEWNEPSIGKPKTNGTYSRLLPSFFSPKNQLES